MDELSSKPAENPKLCGSGKRTLLFVGSLPGVPAAEVCQLVAQKLGFIVIDLNGWVENQRRGSFSSKTDGEKSAAMAQQSVAMDAQKKVLFPLDEQKLQRLALLQIAAALPQIPASVAGVVAILPSAASDSPLLSKFFTAGQLPHLQGRRIVWKDTANWHILKIFINASAQQTWHLNHLGAGAIASIPARAIWAKLQAERSLVYNNWADLIYQLPQANRSVDTEKIKLIDPNELLEKMAIEISQLVQIHL